MDGTVLKCRKDEDNWKIRKTKMKKGPNILYLSHTDMF
jgi:hypothetical protein